MKTELALTIAGSDIFSGGGLQADLTTFSQLGIYGMVAQTCLTTFDNDQLKIDIFSANRFLSQLNSFDKISFNGIKIGLLPSAEIINQTKSFLENQNCQNIVLDPVLVFKENNYQEIQNQKELLKSLFSNITVLTPNLKEAEILSGITIRNKTDMIDAARYLFDLGIKCVVIKGDQTISSKKAIDLYFDGENVEFLENDRLNKKSHGAGCTFSSAITALLIKGYSLLESVKIAKGLVYKTIKYGNHFGVSQYAFKK
ncbi:phosphomethylpyrimidine kinase [Streptococcus urinalis FB127-CNA-2]|uniref:pyridoxal kinase n=1 Tax=Streptococcus urinalis 2285-97 TaxID=764291 RepID=G5KD99_9STRE|nr:bifunctional hydroxymethylpyrimidine kinase/phosphomethylpyrimidine kinase [Streptococcus urinalis]EHJ57751.1 putative phosphomethylpyrimidine kinase [Streptococcus urinalis 2285-97]EKS17060.1 phosphomethylpyrimidine kinase [Streptococcus urinalis FB127-CNA-2]VEF32690.1 phosphomethylpyrimidine kinase [Streptococcus urinalis]